MKTIICGSRHFTNYDFMESCLIALPWTITEVVSGGVRGADTLGEKWADEMGIPIKIFHADWAKFHKAAGPVRNKEMSLYAEACVAFLYKDSRGTANMILQATKQGLRVHVVHCDKPDPWSIFDDEATKAV